MATTQGPPRAAYKMRIFTPHSVLRVNRVCNPPARFLGKDANGQLA
jgi:hypothetical protein